MHTIPVSDVPSTFGTKYVLREANGRYFTGKAGQDWISPDLTQARQMDAPEYGPTGGAARLDSRIPGELPICIHPRTVRLRVPT